MPADRALDLAFEASSSRLKPITLTFAKTGQGTKNKDREAMVWILQELKLVEGKRIEILLELPMREDEEVETACKIRMRDLCARELGPHAVRALKGDGDELFRWTLLDEQRRLDPRALIGLRRSAVQEDDVPPLPITVAMPVQQVIIHYVEVNGNTAAVNSADLVARVQGFVQEIKYQDGAMVKKGTLLFIIESEPYEVKLAQARAAEASLKATFKQALASYE